MSIILTILGVSIGIILVAMVYACCVIAGQCDKQEELNRQKLDNK